MKLNQYLQNLLICLGLFGLLGSDGLTLSGNFQESLEKEASFDTEEEIEAIASRRAEIQLAQSVSVNQPVNDSFYQASFTQKPFLLTASPLYIRHRSLLI